LTAILTLHSPGAAKQFYAQGLWRDETLYALLRRNAQRRPEAAALRDPYGALSWAQFLEAVDNVAAALHEAGLKPGERVSIWLPSRVEAVIVLLACSRNGYVCNTSLHQNYTVEEIAALLGNVKTRALFAQVGYGADNRGEAGFERLRAVSSLCALYALQGRDGAADAPLPEGTLPFPGQQDAAPPPVVTNPDKITYLAFTSGTTGIPKSVMHSDNTLLANARCMVEDWGHGEHTVLCSLSPVSHHIGTVALNQVLVAGCQLVLTDPAAGIAPIDWLEMTGATYVMGVPTHAIDILAALQREARTKLGQVSIFYMAGAPIPQETADRLLAMGVTPQNIYGMTENGSHSYTMPHDPREVITGTCGRSCKAYEVKIFNEERPDEEAPPATVGEIGGKGAMLMLGYFGNQDATENTFNRHGYLMSGDLGRVDEQGNLQVMGRRKDIIIRGGHNIHPARIEDLALRHPGVLRAAAIPVPDDRLGEQVCLAIMLAGTDEPSGEDMVRHLFDRGLSRYDLPEFFVVLGEFPLTASGKILKRVLIEWHRASRFAPVAIERVALKENPA
jgi:acyl-CoA synthetase